MKKNSDNNKRSEGLRAMAVLDATFKYQEQMQATPTGRRSDDLRKEAQGLVKRGDTAGAHMLFLRAMAEHPADDDGAAAAACWFDLGMSFKDVQTGTRAQNLLEALRLFRRAEEAPVRRADVRRHILSLDGLGQVLRAIALEIPGQEEARVEALQHLRKAVELAKFNGLATMDLLTNALGNLGNALRQGGQLDEAIRAHEESIRVATRIQQEAPFLIALMTRGLQLPLQRLNLVAALARRGRQPDLLQSMKIIDAIVQGQNHQITSRANLFGYDIAKRLGDSYAGRAKRHLQRVDVLLLPFEEQQQYLKALADEGEIERAITLAQRGVSDAFNKRHTAKADADADRCAAEAQRFSRIAAELLASANRPVDAFLALEDTSALRYFDWITRYAWAPQTPLLRTLDKLYRRASDLSVMLDDLALRIAGLDPNVAAPEMGQLFDAILRHWRAQPNEFEWDGSTSQLERVFTRARVNAIPGDVLRSHSHLLSGIAVSIHKEMKQLDPRLLEVMQTCLAETASKSWLDEIFSEHSEVVLLRLSMDADDLLAVAVWQDEVTLAGASMRFPVPPGTINALFTLTHDEHSDDARRKDAQALLHAFLTTIDLSCVLPKTPSHVIILPSLVASLVPWAASGPQGRLLLDVTDAVSYLPNLTPLLMRQAPWTLRSGALVITPGEHSSGLPTRFHNLAFAEASRGETRLCGAAATTHATRDLADSADIVSFFAHGHYGDDSLGAVRLADGDLIPTEHFDVWRGIERVELWACRSGVNVSYDHLTPWVDEAFGLDVILHHLGVRSTIGTFWNVPDLVTALLVHEYRRALARGRSAPAALADAQRWWQTAGIVKVRSALESEDYQLGLKELVVALGGDAQSAEALTFGMLSPINPKKLSQEKVDELLRTWASPTAWAGFRFLGVFNRRPHGEAMPEESVSLSPDERSMIVGILNSSQSTPSPDTEFERKLSVATTLGNESPSTIQAITAARLYATRRRSSQAHNIVRALAWIHEALAAPSLSNTDRVQLQRESAWLWFELAIDETPLALRNRRLISANLWGRATKAIRLLSLEPDRTVLELGLAVVLNGSPAADMKLHVVWEKVRTEPSESIEGLRLRTLLVSLLLADTTTVPRQLAASLLTDCGSIQVEDDIARRWHARYAVGLSQLLARPGLEDLPTPSLPLTHYLPHALFLAQCNLTAQAMATPDGLPDGVFIDIVSNVLSLMESDFWGYRHDDGVPAWIATGSPGAGWHRFVGILLARSLALPQAPLDGARHFIASLHLGADLRMGPLAATATLHGRLAPETRPVDLSVFVRDRELHLTVLLDAAAIGQDAAASDLFFRSRLQTSAPTKMEPKYLTGWLANAIIESWEWDRFNRTHARTAAFDLERRIIEFDTEIIRMAPQFAATINEMRNTVDEPRFNALLDLAFGPPRDLAVLERRLATLPPDVAVLGAFEGARGELLLGTVWTENGQTRQEIHITKDASGAKIALLVAEIQRVREEDLGESRGRSTARAQDWAELRSLLDAPLGAVMHGIGRRTLRILAPHSLRSLPWLGLTANGEPLHTRVRGVSLLPFLGFEDLSTLRQIPKTPIMLCVLGGTPEHGETRFGALAIQTLRRVFPNTLAGEPQRPQGTTITEADLIESLDRDIQVLRFYGTGSPWAQNTSLEGIALSHKRIMVSHNIDRLRLASCECVELWAATEGSGASSRQASGHDSLPSLVRGFLTAGAGGVVDLAWPVHDLVKALVCERFALIRRSSVCPSDALALAVSDITMLLADWKSACASFTSVSGALAWLDARRRETVHLSGLADAEVVPFAPLAATAAPSAAALIETCCHPVHLAAFRWWGA
jgi:tetratricopeptide (TPR) repeat protein